MKFSETLLQLRKAQGLSQEALAEKIGVSRQAVSKWETSEALPDLQKAVLLSETLNVSLDQLCGKEVSSSAAETPAAQKRHVWPVVLSVLCLCAGLLLGGLLFGRSSETPRVPAMPDVVTASDVSFSAWGTEHAVTYQFVPSVAGDSYTYRISFTDREGNTQGFDALYHDGMCAGTVTLSPYGEYSVAVTIHNGIETRAIALASGLTVFDNRVSWMPVAP